jgi:hypothetical protein
MAQLVNVPLMQGDETSRTWQITSDGEPLDLSNATVAAVIKASAHVDDDDPAAIQRTEDDGITIADAAQGEVTIAIPATVTQYPGAWYYKILRTIEDDTQVAVHGWITITDT